MRVATSALVLLTLALNVLAGEKPGSLLPKLGIPGAGGVVKKPSSGKPREIPLIARINSFSSRATSVAFSPDGRSLAVGTKDSVQLIDVETKSIVREIPTKSGQVLSLVFSGDGTTLIAGAYQSVSLWNVATGDFQKGFKGHRGYVTGLAISPDGKRLATSCEDEIARVWTLDGEGGPLEFKHHKLPVTGVAWSPNGDLIATAAGDENRPTKAGQVAIWNAVSGDVQQTFELHTRAATSIAFSADGKYVASGGVDEHVNVYDLAAKKPLGFFAGHSRPTNAVLFHPDEETAISVSGGRAVGKNELKLWEFMSGDEIASVEAHEGRVNALALSKDGRLLATAGNDKTVALWNVGFLSVGLPEVAGVPTTSSTRQDQDGQSANPSQQVSNLNQGDEQKTVVTNAVEEPKPLRAGIIGLDTSHCIAFSKTLNANPQKPEVAGVRMVAVYPKGSPDIKSSVERVPGYLAEMRKLNVEVVDSIEELLTKVDFVFLETNDGRPHLEQYVPVAKAGKPCFIDKPIAGSLSDAIAIFEVSRKYKAPIFSSSSLRFGKNSQAARNGAIGKVLKCETSSPASLEPTHPDLFWYGIHGVESLFTVMGVGCQAVSRGKSADGKIEVHGKWSENREGTFREGSGYVGKAVGEKGEAAVGAFDGYDPLLFEIIKFARTGKPPVSEAETLEIYAFMEAADESKRQNGASVTIESVMSKAKAEAAGKLAELK